MKLLIAATILAVVLMSDTATAVNCTSFTQTRPLVKNQFMWGEDCDKPCGFCTSGTSLAQCDFDTGNCKTSTCQQGWTGDKCTTAVCKKNPCASGYACIAPDVCDCGTDINKVAPSCNDLRARGILGSIAALVTITASIALCGLGSKVYKRRKDNTSL